MNKSAARGIGFVGALGATVALIGAAVSTTGAYFTDSHNGNIAAGTGSVRVDTSDTQLNFDDLLPGDYKTQQIDYRATGTGTQDLWFVLPAGADANTLTGQNSDTALGRYGHFKLTSPDGSFVSNNLRAGTDPCSVDANGHGGSNQEATSTNNSDPGSYVPYCPAPNAILLQQNMNPGDTGSMQVEFGYTKILKGGQSSGRQQVAKYKIVATQHGVRPDNVNNPQG